MKTGVRLLSVAAVVGLAAGASIDVFMPGMDGLQLLRVLNVEFPSLPKVLLTGMPDGNTREQARMCPADGAAAKRGVDHG